MSDIFEDEPSKSTSSWDEYDRLILSIRSGNWSQVNSWLNSERTRMDEKRQMMLTRSRDYVFSTSRAIPFQWCCFYDAPDEILMKFIELGGKELALVTDDNYGSNSLIWAVTNRVSLDVVKKLVSLNGDLPLMTNHYGNNALHMACRFDQDFLVIQHLVREGAPFNILHTRNKDLGELPIHVACSHHYDIRVIKLLLSEGSGEETVKVKDNEGFTPLVHAYRDGATAEIVEFLVDKSSYIDQKDGNRTKVRNETAFQMMKWLSKQDDIVLKRFLSKPFVRKLLNSWFIQPVYLGTLMCDLYVQIALVCVYSFIDEDIILGSKPFGTFGLVLLYIGFAWRLLREVLQILSIPLNLYVRDIWNYLDLALIHFTLRTAIFLSQQHALSGYEAGVLTFATGFVWFHFILVLSNLRYEVCVFVVALQNVVLKLLPFYITSLIIVFSFGNMFYIANVLDDQECTNDGLPGEGFLCTLPHSYFTTFTMLLNGNWIKFNDPVLNLPTLLSITFAIIIGLLLLNILIAEISHAYGEMREQSRISFWANRLSFISEISFALSLFPRIRKSYKQSESHLHFEDSGKKKRFNFDDNSMSIYKDITAMMRNGTMTSEEKDFFLWWNNGKDVATPPFFTRLKIFMNRSRVRDIVLPGRAIERILSTSEMEEKAYIPRIIAYLITPIIWAFLTLVSMLGLVTFGLTWPQGMKCWLFFGPTDAEGSLEGDVSVVKEKVEYLQSKIGRLESKIDELLLERERA